MAFIEKVAFHHIDETASFVLILLGITTKGTSEIPQKLGFLLEFLETG